MEKQSFTEKARIEQITHLKKNYYLLKMHSPEIALKGKPGQFCNIKITDTVYPLLRRPFSICNIEGEYLYFMFNTHGEGTKMLASANKGDVLDILGPLGNGFRIPDNLEHAVIVAGGIGAAPFAYLIESLPETADALCFVGGRTADDLLLYGMKNIFLATDDGSEGIKGNVIDLLGKNLHKLMKPGTVLFACGPNAMLSALKKFCIDNNLECQISTESAMACGFGICQGCNVESATEKDKYKLVCCDGPVFDVREIEL